MGLGVILDCFFRALGQIGDKRFNSVLLRGVGVTLLLQIAATFGVVWLMDALLGDTLSNYAWVETALKWLGGVLTLMFSALAMIPVASAISSMFLDEVAQAVEDKHYPALPPATQVPFSDTLRDALGFLGVVIFANLLALILYFTPLGPLVFWGLNGFLLGREYFMVAAMRRLGREKAKVLRRKHAGAIWMAGVLMVVPLTIPLVNLLVPILGAATFTHLYHASQSRA